jgi:putative transposase
MDAVVVMPDHLHCVWRLPEEDSDFSSRWREIKKFVTRRIMPENAATQAQVWQPRFWEHLIRDAKDWRRHIDYIHYNPVKHGYSSAPREWQYSSFHTAVRRGWYEPNWGRACPDNLTDTNFE